MLDEYAVVLFAFDRLENTRLQWLALINMGVEHIFLFQDSHPDKLAFDVSIPEQVTLIERKQRIGQFRNYHSAFLQLKNSYKWVLVFEDDLNLNKLRLSSLTLNPSSAHINIGMRHPNIGCGEISTWGYALNLDLYPSSFYFGVHNIIKTLTQSGRFMRRNFVVQLAKSVTYNPTWALCWQMHIDTLQLTVGDLGNLGIESFPDFYNGENVRQPGLTNENKFKNMVLNLVALSVVFLYRTYNYKVKQLCEKY